MAHVCHTTLEEQRSRKNIKWFMRIKLMSEDHPQRFCYFRSDLEVREEQERHLKVNRHSIHPLSSFRAWYEIYLLYLYGSLLLTKPVDAAFLRIRYQYNTDYVRYTLFTDFMSWIDIIMNFMTGYEIKGSRGIELRRRQIALNYILGPYFFVDVVSSVPKAIAFPFRTESFRGYIFGVLDLMAICKLVRFISLLKYFYKATEYFRVRSKGAVFLCCTAILSFYTLHWMACLQFAVPKLAYRSFKSPPQRKGWFFVHNLYEIDFWVQYIHCFFKSSAYILGVRLSIYRVVTPEEYMLVIFTYLIGKILIAVIWIVLAMAIINARSIEIKFAEKMNQLEEYMNQKRLPSNLRSRIWRYFNFRFQRKYFQEELITGTLSTRLKKEINVHGCKTLIQNVALFHDLSSSEITKVITHLVPEIYMPHDIIISSGGSVDAMFFLASGTVAVYTRTGMEVCHLEDGAYFGEICLLLKDQPRLMSVVAIETTYVYRLSKYGLDTCFKNNKRVMQNILDSAQQRLRNLTQLDELHQQMLFEQTYKTID